ncbi:hypothetical protein H112_06598 [Trichophyton rubrum D6]|uniref:SPT2 chromatin protein n=4 Tax=Trichophyton TaxID=5550 RepID=A0A178F0T3_TRIRU|nr:uncharacterized protein TERG_01954 [Trichophyton rubrum CBS 118892]EZF12481.1 hypothetical protein H100_06615 [Trichophyton rubrum MR850]EZF39245.1 hypothetical protein H102_06581 [Trichophyton rubrum CBS 100081]EZF49892.1 hypothetical protein H103_06606 [Trichophyton rubrum CBS 288.86]EZF60528.1 hypothetical protein H104_06561 [Trichophyton rubrum CBS 289.86]EZF71213.1 hypothetical protein H105_06618 [Trichophyton soudanense CBS 452.61]EZF81720.1 hypothetical protein H110_06602 [Trichophy
MSFLNSVLSSIETGEVSITPPPPPKSTTPDSTSSNQKPSLNSKLAATSISGNSNGYTGTAQKRKADEQLTRPAPRNDRFSKPLPSSSPQPVTPASRLPRDSDAARKPASKPASSTTAASKPVLSKTSAAPVSTKPPPKGSYAAIMAEAKALQNKAPAAVGLIKHQAVPKDKKSKVQQKKMTEEAKQRDREPANRKLSTEKSAATAPSRSTKEAILKARQAEMGKQEAYKGTARPRPGSLPPARSSESSYSGTSGLPSRRAQGREASYGRIKSRRASRNEYLGTDEEDEGDYGYEDEDDYSDESDMEAGFLDVEEEEQTALRIAKQEDAEELRLEMAAKKEKMERKMKLNALAKSRR